MAQIDERDAQNLDELQNKLLQCRIKLKAVRALAEVPLIKISM
jgi:hypothetical protein